MSALKIVAIANQKGGVGKTTTAINLSAALAELGFKVLLVDMDPQGNASTGLGLDAPDRHATSFDLLVGEVDEIDIIHPTAIENLSLIPSTVDLSSADIDLVSNEKRIFLLKEALSKTSFQKFDFVLIDCPPSLNLLTVNALVAAHSIIVPLQSEFFALEGLSQLLSTVREVRQSANANLRIDGVLLTMYDKRNNLSQQVEEDARSNLGDLVYQTVIPRNVRLSEAPSYALPVLSYDPSSRGALAYRELASEMLNKKGIAPRKVLNV